MLTIKEIFDICKEHGVCVDLSYIDVCYNPQDTYIIKLYYNRQRFYRLIDQLDLEHIFADRKSFDKYVREFLEEAKAKEENNVVRNFGSCTSLG